jgi:hypothetical protein
MITNLDRPGLVATRRAALRQAWAIHFFLHQHGRVRDRALFAVDSKFAAARW